MAQTAVLSPYDLLNDSKHVLTVLERYRSHLPVWAHEAITHHQTLHRDLKMHLDTSERALNDWREALARRWECEVAGQRFYLELQQQVQDYFGGDSPHVQVFSLSPDTNARTASELLADLRRTEAALRLIQPRPSFMEKQLQRLAAICAELHNALEQTYRCEARRRSAMFEQRVALTAYKRARVRTESLFAEYLGEQAVLELSGVSDVSAHTQEPFQRNGESLGPSS